MEKVMENIQNALRLWAVLVMVAVAVPLFSQNSAGDKLYNEGKVLQKKGDCERAIAKFKSARDCYDSADKKKQCDDAIKECKKPAPPIPTPVPKPIGVIDAPDNTILSVSRERLEMDENSHTETINVQTTEQKWTVTPVFNEGETPFFTVNAHPEEKSFDIICEANNGSRPRSQYLKVSAGKKTKIIEVKQSGKPVELYVETAVVTFGNMPIISKTKKSIKIYSNSDEKVEENNNMNWKVLSKPSWVNVIGERLKEKKRKNVSATDENGIVTSIMNIVPLPKPTGPGAPTRSGEIIIVSGNQQATIIVQQD